MLPRSRAVKHDTSSHPFTPHSKAFVRTAGLLPVPQPDGSTAHRNRPLERVAGHTAPSPRLTQRPISLIKACEQEGGGGGWRHHVATRARRSTDACPPHDPNPPPLQVAFPLHPSVRLRARTVGTARPPARPPPARLGGLLPSRAQTEERPVVAFAVAGKAVRRPPWRRSSAQGCSTMRRGSQSGSQRWKVHSSRSSPRHPVFATQWALASRERPIEVRLCTRWSVAARRARARTCAP